MWKSKKQAEWEYKQIKNDIRIVDYASSIGLTVSRAGKYYTLKEHDSVRIDPERNIFIRNSNNKAGSIIDFAVEFTNRDISTVLTEFTKMIYDKGYTFNSFENPSKSELNKKSIQPPGEIILPERDNTIKNVFAYLVQTRKIDKEIVSRMIQKKNLYQDKYKNCVFVSYDQDCKPVFAGLRGTNPNKRFLGDLKGCDYEKCFFIDNNSRSTIVTESVIDGMSMMTLVKGRGEDYNSYNYLMLGSANKYNAVFNYMDNDSNKKWILCLDNDTAGRHFTEKIKEICKAEVRQVEIIDSPPKIEQDWNKELQTIRENNYRNDYFIPNKDQERILEKILDTTEKETTIEEIRTAHIPGEFLDYIEKYKINGNRADSLNMLVEHFNRQGDIFLDNADKRKIPSHREGGIEI